MQTDISLKRLTRLRPEDLLSLLGIADATVMGVETLELPASRSSLDTVLQLRTPDGQEYLHVIEWQGWRDPFFLWRTLGYLAWLGQNRDERPILVTIVYLTPGDDIGDMLAQDIDGVGGWSIRFHCVRLWEQDAHTAVSSGMPGLMALSPLMRGATAELVTHAAQQIIAQVSPPVQGELLAVLGGFAEPLMEPERFVRLVTKERLMATDLISYLTQEKTAELEQKLAAQETFMRQTLQQAIEEAVVTRFPHAPIALVHTIRRIAHPDQLQQVLMGVIRAADMIEAERVITTAAGHNDALTQ